MSDNDDDNKNAVVEAVVEVTNPVASLAKILTFNHRTYDLTRNDEIEALLKDIQIRAAIIAKSMNEYQIAQEAGSTPHKFGQLEFAAAYLDAFSSIFTGAAMSGAFVLPTGDMYDECLANYQGCIEAWHKRQQSDQDHYTKQKEAAYTYACRFCQRALDRIEGRIPVDVDSSLPFALLRTTGTLKGMFSDKRSWSAALLAASEFAFRGTPYDISRLATGQPEAGDEIVYALFFHNLDSPTVYEIHEQMCGYLPCPPNSTYTDASGSRKVHSFLDIFGPRKAPEETKNE